MSRLAKRYLLYTFVIMLLGWGSCLLCSMSGVYLSESPVLYIPYLLGGLSPTIAAYFSLRREGRIASFKDWLKANFDFRHSILSYLLPLVFAGAFFTVLCIVSSYERGVPFVSIVYLLPMMLFAGGLEEAGWRGLLQPELEKKYSYTLAVICVAVIWWLWHLPLFYIKGVGQYGTDFLAFGCNVLGLSFVLAAIKRTTGSTWLCVLFHCLVNSLHSIYLVGNNIIGNIAAAAVLALLSYITLWIQEKKHVFE